MEDYDTNKRSRVDKDNRDGDEAIKERRGVWHHEPWIKPNYGKRKSLMPKSNVKQVILFENPNEGKIAEQRMKHIRGQERWSRNLLELQKKSFIIRQLLQQESLHAQGICSASFLPKVVIDTHRRHAKMKFMSMSYTGGKDLPLHRRLNTFHLKKTFDDDEGENKPDEVAMGLPRRQKIQNGFLLDKLPTLASGKNERKEPKRKKQEADHGAAATQGLPRIAPVKRSVTFSDAPRQVAQKSLLKKKGDGVMELRKEKTAPVLSLRSVQDTRFKQLEDSLSASNSPRDGYVMLSSSSWGGGEDEVSQSDARIIRTKFMPKLRKQLTDIKFEKMHALVEAYAADDGVEYSDDEDDDEEDEQKEKEAELMRMRMRRDDLAPRLTKAEQKLAAYVDYIDTSSSG